MRRVGRAKKLQCETRKRLKIQKSKILVKKRFGQCVLCSGQWWSPRGRPWPRGHILKSLASKPQVLGLGLEALGPRKLPCPRLEDSTIF